jgi:hypothetical protein
MDPVLGKTILRATISSGSLELPSLSSLKCSTMARSWVSLMKPASRILRMSVAFMGKSLAELSTSVFIDYNGGGISFLCWVQFAEYLQMR